MKINFITNQDLKEISGGWSGINYNIHHEILKYFEVNYVGSINPKMDFFEKLVSKVKRTMGLKGNFSFYSSKRLSKIQLKVGQSIDKDGDYDLYFGQTPWLYCNYDRPYGVYLDADFRTYLKIFSNIDSFKEKDVNRIAREEERWLKNARDIFVGSDWAWGEMIKCYDLREDQKVVVHTGGNISMPEKDRYSGGYNLVFISLNFEKKGGLICVESYKNLKEKYPEMSLTIIGDRPPNEILDIDGVNYVGFLRKTVKKELEQFVSILSEAFLLVHPTKMDTMGAVLVESGYFGCPSIAPRSFGVPELVHDGETGFIVDVPFTTQDFSKKIELLINDEELYANMRKNSWEYTRQNLTWQTIGQKIKLRIER